MSANVQRKQTAVKVYDGVAFVIDDRKLSRISEIASERLQTANGDSCAAVYSATFQDGKLIRLTTLEQVLALDNAIGNPIVRLDAELFTCSNGGEPNRENAPNLVSFVFGSLFPEDHRIRLYARSVDVAWLTETMGALEEQAERCMPTDLGYKVRKHVWMIGFVVFIVTGGAIALVFDRSRAQSPRLSEAELSLLKTSATAAHSDSDKIEVMFRFIKATLEATRPTSDVWRYVTDIHTYLAAVPLLIAGGASLFAVLKYYPYRAFVWGDYGDCYRRMLERRRSVWLGIVVALAIGILANLFIIGLGGLK